MSARIKRRGLVPAACAAVALLCALLALVPALRPVGWDLTALPRVAAHTGMGVAAKHRDAGFHTVATNDYDGQFYWGIAVDPLAIGDVHQSFDTASYRYGHPLLGWLGWVLSAGQARAVPAALLAVGLAALMLGALAASLYDRARGGRGWWGLLVAANPGLVYAAVHDLAEPLSAALLFGGLLAYTRGRRVVALACFAALILSKEQFVLVPVGLALWEVVRRRGRVRDAAILLTAVVPAAAWWVYARVQLGAWFTSGDTALGAPFAGWRRALTDAGIQTYSLNGRESVAGEAELVILASLLGVLTLGGVLALRGRTPVDVVYVLLAVLAACLAANATTLLRDALRNTAVLLALTPFVIASLPRRPMSTARPGEGSSTAPPPSPT